jgi:hypothetical protein
VDRVSISFPVDHFEPDRLRWDDVRQRPRAGVEVRGTTVDVEGSTAFVGVAQVLMDDGSRPWFGKVEVNPSRVGDPDGVALCPAGEVRDRLRHVLEVATAELVSPAAQEDDYRVKRLDVARDFDGVRDVGGLLLGLASVHRPHSRRNDLYNDATRAGAQTLMVGSKAGVTRLYDKFAQSKGTAPEGTLRWETEARADWCRRNGQIETLGDVTERSVAQLAENRWRWSGMDAEVCTRNEVVARVMSAPKLTDRERTFFLGWLMQSAAGHEPVTSTATAAKYRRLSRDLGVALGPETFAGAVMGRLDWDEGTVVLRAA